MIKQDDIKDDIMMKRQKKFNPNNLPPWTKKASVVVQQFIVPFTIFQAIRTLIFPTFIDILLLALFIFLAAFFYVN